MEKAHLQGRMEAEVCSDVILRSRGNYIIMFVKIQPYVHTKDALFENHKRLLHVETLLVNINNNGSGQPQRYKRDLLNSQKRMKLDKSYVQYVYL